MLQNKLNILLLTFPSFFNVLGMNDVCEKNSYASEVKSKELSEAKVKPNDERTRWLAQVLEGSFFDSFDDLSSLENDNDKIFEYIKDFADSEGQKSYQKVLAVSQFLKLKDIAQELKVDYSSVLFDLYMICVAKKKSFSQETPRDIGLQNFDSGTKFINSTLCKLGNLGEERKLKYIQESELRVAQIFFKLKTISDKNKKIYQFEYKQYLEAVCQSVIYFDLEVEKNFKDISLELRKLKNALNKKCHFNLQSLTFGDLDLIESSIENLKTVDDKTLEKWGNFSKNMSSKMNEFFDLLKNYTTGKGDVKPLLNKFNSLDLLALYNECAVFKTNFQQKIINNLVDYLTEELSAEPFVVLNKLLEEMLEGCESFQDKLNSIEKFLSLRVNGHVSKLDEGDASIDNLYNHAKKHFLPNQPVEEIKINRRDIFNKAGHGSTMITGFGDKDLYISMTNLWNDLSNLQCNPPMYFYETPESNSESLKSFRVRREYKVNKDKLIEGGYIIFQSHFIDAKLENNKVSVTEYEVNSCTIIRTVEQVSLDGDGNFTVVPITFFFKPDYTTQLSMSQRSSIATDLEKKLSTDQEENSSQPPKENPTQFPVYYPQQLFCYDYYNKIWQPVNPQEYLPYQQFYYDGYPSYQ